MTGRATSALAGAAAALLLLLLTWALALHVGIVERADQSIFAGFSSLQSRPRVSRLATFIAHLCNPSPYVYLAALPLLVALVRRRPRVLMAIAAILLCANVTTETLKALLVTPRAHAELGYQAAGPGSWPSGHATAAMSLALCCVLAAPARLRPAVAALGAAFAIGVSYSFLALGWHYPSDVFGGFLVAAAWTLLALAALYGADVRWPRGAARERSRISLRDALAPQVAVLVGVLALVAGVALSRPHAVFVYARAHETFLLGAAAIGMLALSLAGLIAYALRR